VGGEALIGGCYRGFLSFWGVLLLELNGLKLPGFGRFWYFLVYLVFFARVFLGFWWVFWGWVRGGGRGGGAASACFFEWVAGFVPTGLGRSDGGGWAGVGKFSFCYFSGNIGKIGCGIVWNALYCVVTGSV